MKAKKLLNKWPCGLTRTAAIREKRHTSIIVGTTGRRRTMHFRPDGTSYSHRGVHCVCSINDTLDELQHERTTG